jgi:murein DD-endopeptidase MepM/ murein hydrolase activator NlpD
MKKDTFSVIIVPHDIKKTRTYRVPYRLFHTFLFFVIIGAIVIIVFIATYGKILVKTRETVRLEHQVAELTKRNEQIGELMRNLAQMRTLDSHVRRMLGVDNSQMEKETAENAAIEDEAYDVELRTKQTQMLMAIPSFWPVKGYITKGFNIAGGTKDEQYHPGIDISVGRGTVVRAAASGYIIEAKWDDVYGYYVKIDHGYGIKTLYGHNERLVVMKGERVGRGQTIAYSGNTGMSTAPHVHFEVMQDNVYVDPLRYLLQ